MIQRRATVTGSARAARLPAEVRLMNTVAGVIFVLAALALVGAAAKALARSTWFPLRVIALETGPQRVNVGSLRTTALPRLAGNFFSLDLHKARAAFEQVPWVRRAVVRRVWPDRLAVRLEEHQAAALWSTEDGNEKLVNAQGEVFDANVGDVEDQYLPLLTGPEGSAARMLAMWQRLAPVVERMDHELVELVLSDRGSWRAELDGELTLELGRGSDDDVLARTDRFARTLPQLTAAYKSPLLSADLRHADGYAVRMRGVGTTAIAPASGGPTPAPAPAARRN